MMAKGDHGDKDAAFERMRGLGQAVFDDLAEDFIDDMTSGGEMSIDEFEAYVDRCAKTMREDDEYEIGQVAKAYFRAGYPEVAQPILEMFGYDCDGLFRDWATLEDEDDGCKHEEIEFQGTALPHGGDMIIDVTCRECGAGGSLLVTSSMVDW